MRSRSTIIACALVASLGMIAEMRGAGPRFYPDDPVAVDNDRLLDVTKPRKVELDDYYDFLKNNFAAPGDHRKVHAVNVNTLDEVPDSSWFTNRIGVRDMPMNELLRGTDRDVTFSTKWTIVRGKNRGFQPGFRAVDKSDPTKTVYGLEVDPPRYPELSTGAEVVGAVFYNAFGYNTEEVYITEIDPAALEISPKAWIKDANGRRPFVQHDLDEVLKNAARLPNGHIRMSAERLIRGDDDLGKFEYHGTRDDDPNDIYPHEHRRELRGSRVFAAWLDHDDSRALNTRVVPHHEGGRTFLKYYLVDFGSILGSATRFPHDPQSGHEYTIAKRPSLLTLFSFGFYVQPYLRLPDPPVPPAVGRFSADGFDPDAWVAEYPKTAYDNMRADDAFWAARIVARFSDDQIRAILGKGKYSDPAAVDVLANTVIKRRDRIKDVWLTGVNPIVNVSLSADGELRFENAAAMYGVGGRPEGYALRWSRFDNATDTHTPQGDEMVVTETHARAPSAVLAGSDYISVQIDTRHARYPSWVPVQVYFRRTSSGWQTVGLDRGLDRGLDAKDTSGRRTS